MIRDFEPGSLVDGASRLLATIALIATPAYSGEQAASAILSAPKASINTVSVLVDSWRGVSGWWTEVSKPSQMRIYIDLKELDRSEERERQLRMAAAAKTATAVSPQRPWSPHSK